MAAPASAPAQSAQTTNGSASCARVSAAAPIVDAPSAAAEAGEVAWAVPAADLAKYDAIFEVAKGADGKICGAKAAAVLNRSGLPRETLRAVWSLVDVCTTPARSAASGLRWPCTWRPKPGGASRCHPLESTAALGAGSCFAAQGVRATLVEQAWRAKQSVGDQ